MANPTSRKMSRKKLIQYGRLILTIETGMGPPAPLGYGYGETR